MARVVHCDETEIQAPAEGASIADEHGGGQTAAREPLGPAYVAKAAAALGVLSHETRLQAVLLMAVLGEVNVSNLSQTLGIRQTNLSHHLRILRDAGLVTDRRDGQFVLYRVDVSTWQALADGFFDSLLGGENSVVLRNIRIERLPPL